MNFPLDIYEHDITKERKWNELEKGDENENEKSSNKRVFEGSNKNSQRDKQELPENLNTCPCENTS